MLQELLVPGIPIAEKLLRTVVVYAFLLVGLRLAGKRELGQLNPFDFVVLLLLSNTLQNAIIGNDNSLTGGIIGATALLLVNWVVVRGLYTQQKLARVFEGDAEVLVENGTLNEERLRRALITPEELAAAARRQGVEALDHVETCRLEIGGALTFVAKAPTDDAMRHGELLERMDRLIQEQAVLRQALHHLQARSAT